MLLGALLTSMLILNADFKYLKTVNIMMRQGDIVTGVS